MTTTQGQESIQFELWTEPDLNKSHGLLFKHLWNNHDLSDVKIVCHERCWHVHTSILGAQSQFFLKAFTGNFKEATERVLDLSEEEPSIVEKALEYAYSGGFSVEILVPTTKTNDVVSSADTVGTVPHDGPFVTLVKLYKLADFLVMKGLKELIKKSFHTVAKYWKGSLARSEAMGQPLFQDVLPADFGHAVQLIYEGEYGDAEALRECALQVALCLFKLIAENDRATASIVAANTGLATDMLLELIFQQKSRDEGRDDGWSRDNWRGEYWRGDTKRGSSTSLMTSFKFGNTANMSLKEARDQGLESREARKVRLVE
ncbi:uncharacterized protein BCR38DRAFT_488468 [Pseudomassariella vexata]|uniref:BTB domain-containing protein n=1 Tax=Pseudomassariella vexata TaxID=1141098 RepID=A0A1Y2DM09_9PEZI|nr:uncharacterized protein BCR38DRAFT_488468 [Pseudomassariella vexata]ORY60287.1 hypothetical protein BCR38DRAFT_488468 [Pseudomassariella vexata]